MARERMSRRDMIRKQKEELRKRTEESHKRKDEKGGFKDFFNKEKMNGVKKWWADKNEHIIDIIPYFAGKQDPRNKEGEPAYVLDIEVHQNVGPADDVVVCPEQYGDRCPICEEARRLNKEKADWKTEIKPLKPKRRVVYNVIVRDGGEQEKKGVQIFEIAHFFMEAHLAKIARNARTGGFEVFSDPDTGKSIVFERTGTGAENTAYSGHRFAERVEPISDEELEAAHCLDDLLEIKSYDEIYDLFYGKSSPSKGEDEGEEPEMDEPEQNEPDDEPEQEEPKEKPVSNRRLERRGRKTHHECPGGGKIGVDIDELEHCDSCDIYDKCADIADAMGGNEEDVAF
jgi:hypothetical protein